MAHNAANSIPNAAVTANWQRWSPFWALSAANSRMDAAVTAESGALAGLLADLPGPDLDARDQVAARAATVLRPAGAFARLDAVAAWLAGWQDTATPRVERPHVVVFAADHGVAADGVSAYPAEVTAAMLDAIDSGVATISVLAREVGATLELVDVGVGRPTGNIRVSDAMSRAEFDAAVTAGAAAVDGADADLLVAGEIGIGNTTAAAAVAAAVLGGAAADWVGPGTGVVGAALARKCDIVQAALDRVGTVQPLEALRLLGGRELAAMAGAVAAARHGAGCRSCSTGSLPRPRSLRWQWHAPAASTTASPVTARLSPATSGRWRHWGSTR